MVYRYSQLIAHLLFFCFGLVGAHHIYLQRFRHAFVTAVSFGGGFGVGLFFDLCHLRGYVHQANAIARGNYRRFQSKGDPPFDYLKFLSTIIFSIFLSVVAIASVPQFLEQNMVVVGLVSALAVAIGTHTVSNIGLTSCSFKWCLLPALAWIPVFVYCGRATIQDHFYFQCLISSYAANYKIAWADFESRQIASNSRRIVTLVILAGSLLFFAGFANFFLSNVQIVDSTNKQKVALGEFLKDVEWRMILGKAATVLWNWNILEMIDLLPDIVMRDKELEEAYKILNVSYWASNEVFSNAYKEYVKKYHPDKFATENEEKRREAQDHFIKIQQAYEAIVKSRSKKKHNDL